MNYLKFIAVLLFLSFFIACNKSDSGPQVPVITGISMTDFQANPIGIMGIDNSKTYGTNIKKVIVYPNPCIHVIDINFSSLVSDSAKVWMMAAFYKNPPSNVIVKNQSLFGKILNASTVYINAGNHGIQYATDSLPNGFYRFYLTTATDTIYENIQVSQ